ncbi:MAG TPA: ABC transporter ATP-binding protein [Candidatus Limnocylindrales bacterium]|jgi:oligopeptide transport system ATP-binding protein|nr:ABC transporter ATP-binding protein [Candidatus Limnocylindrales bacterium]
MSGAAGHLLEVRDLRTEFLTDEGAVHAVNGVSFHLDDGETLAIVGESGSGKSVTMLSVMRLIPQPPGRIVSGEVLLNGRDILRIGDEEMRRLRGPRLAMIFQEPLSSLNPVFSIGDQLGEAISAHQRLSKQAIRDRSRELLAMVNIPGPDRVLAAYPHQLSGGMCQRVMLAMAISGEPSILIADEPTTALDITTQSQLLELVRRLQDRLRMAVVWITHDLGVVAGLADRVHVMYAGRIVEAADVDSLYDDPLHPYTLGLLGCIPRLDEARPERLVSIPGTPPDMVALASGCPFAPRCPFRLDRCTIDDPPLIEELPDHLRACWATPMALRAARPRRVA